MGPVASGETPNSGTLPSSVYTTGPPTPDNVTVDRVSYAPGGGSATSSSPGTALWTTSSGPVWWLATPVSAVDAPLWPAGGATGGGLGSGRHPRSNHIDRAYASTGRSSTFTGCNPQISLA